MRDDWMMGGVRERVRELRDPCVFEDQDGTVYLLYCGAGESGIGLAVLAGIGERGPSSRISAQ